MKKRSIRKPEVIPLGLTRFEARAFAIVRASLVRWGASSTQGHEFEVLATDAGGNQAITEVLRDAVGPRTVSASSERTQAAIWGFPSRSFGSLGRTSVGAVSPTGPTGTNAAPSPRPPRRRGNDRAVPGDLPRTGRTSSPRLPPPGGSGGGSCVCRALLLRRPHRRPAAR